MGEFSLNPIMIRDIFDHAKPMGHHQEPRNLNLGFGFIYYGLIRALRPKHTLVIGSGYGFSVVCLALGIRDNGLGSLSFVDPSYSLFKDGPFKTIGGRANWSDAESVYSHFNRFGVSHLVTHFRMSSEEFFDSYESRRLPAISVAFIDGAHDFKHVKHDFVEVLKRSRPNTYVFLHDSNIYIREMLGHAGVKKWLYFLQKNEKAFQVVDFPFSSGVALVRIVEPDVWKEL
ncbi:MAG: class I SAM-dependent methyltransferase [Desulfomonilaceae bacterium]